MRCVLSNGFETFSVGTECQLSPPGLATENENCKIQDRIGKVKLCLDDRPLRRSPDVISNVIPTTSMVKPHSNSPVALIINRRHQRVVTGPSFFLLSHTIFIPSTPLHHSFFSWSRTIMFSRVQVKTTLVCSCSVKSRTKSIQIELRMICLLVVGTSQKLVAKRVQENTPKNKKKQKNGSCDRNNNCMSSFNTAKACFLSKHFKFKSTKKFSHSFLFFYYVFFFICVFVLQLHDNRIVEIQNSTWEGTWCMTTNVWGLSVKYLVTKSIKLWNLSTKIWVVLWTQWPTKRSRTLRQVQEKFKHRSVCNNYWT